VYNNNNN